MQHSYILQPGKWRAAGQYFDAQQNMVEIWGETEIIHHTSEWLLDGFMELQLDNPIRFFNKYSIRPVADGKDYTNWQSSNPALGKLYGKFMIIQDTILSSWQSDDGEHSGVESLVMTGKDRYQNRGFALHKGNKLSSWSVELVKFNTDIYE